MAHCTESSGGIVKVNAMVAVNLAIVPNARLGPLAIGTITLICSSTDSRF